ncbi:hypothetical protein [Colwellia chukchiensis]|nr:hypothetical protein [Colwellia chukchiensis]
MKGIVVTVAILLLAYPAYLWITYINETITTGSGYGFNIGDTKKEAYSKLNTALKDLGGKNGSAFVQVKSNSQMAKFVATDTDFDVMIKPLFHDVGYEQFEKQELWQFYVDASFFNTLKLEFCNGKLCRIHRHRKFFELP